MKKEMELRTALNLDTNWLKLIGIVAMTCDHAGKILFPDVIILQIIGRIAFPIFAYCIVVGCLYTSNIKAYFLRLGAFAIISQPFITLAFHPQWEDFMQNITVLNIFFTLLLGLAAVYTLSCKQWFWFAVTLLTASFVNIDYGINGILLMLVFYVFRDKPIAALIAAGMMLMTPFFYQGNTMIFGQLIDIQGFAVLALPLIYWKTNVNIRINKYVFYGFYPLHFLALYLLQGIIR